MTLEFSQRRAARLEELNALPDPAAEIHQQRAGDPDPLRLPPSTNRRDVMDKRGAGRRGYVRSLQF